MRTICILTKERGTYIVGVETALDAYNVTILEACFCQRKGTSLTFEKIDMIAGELTIPLSTITALGELDPSITQHYDTYRNLKPVQRQALAIPVDDNRK